MALDLSNLGQPSIEQKLETLMRGQIGLHDFVAQQNEAILALISRVERLEGHVGLLEDDDGEWSGTRP